MNKKKPIIIGNWKMHKDFDESKKFIESIVSKLAKSNVDVYMAPSFISLESGVRAVCGSGIEIVAQNMHDKDDGAYTGEISAKMLKSIGVKSVILGHSERRKYFFENDGFINKKVIAAIKHEFKPVLCIGESDVERQDGKTDEVLRMQLEVCLRGLSSKNLKDLVIAYEPVWAIGTGLSATPETIQETHGLIRAFIGLKWGYDVANCISILYGGSVNDNNVCEIMNMSDVDGILVGGASLDEKKFISIIERM